jgi:non-heme chloroperoxidase
MAVTSRRRAQDWRYLVPAGLAAAVVAGVVIYEHRVLAGLDGTPDPDDGFAFPAERIHAIATPDGGSLHAEEAGSGRPVVLLHGHGANLGIFAPLATRLIAGGRRVVAVDHRGFGRSSAVPSTFGFDGLVDDLATVLTELDLRRALVVGHSMGGAVALALAVDRADVVADRVSALVLVNSSARGPADRPLSRARAAALDWSLTEHVGRHHRHGMVLARANFGCAPRRSHVEAVRAIGFASPVARRLGFTRRLLGIDLSDRLGDVHVPVLVLAGAADRVLPTSESRRIAERVSSARLHVFDGAGHVLPVERSAQVAEQILRFAHDVDVVASSPARACATRSP